MKIYSGNNFPVGGLKDFIEKREELLLNQKNLNREKTKEINNNLNHFEKFIKNEIKYIKNYHKEDLNNIKIFEDFPEILQIMEYLNKEQKNTYEDFIESFKQLLKNELTIKNKTLFLEFEKAINEKNKDIQKDIIEKCIQKSKEEGRDNNLIPLLRFTPFLWSKYDGKETENLRKNIIELNKENKLNLDCIKEINLSNVLKYQEEVFCLEKSNSIKLSPVKSL